MTDLDALIADLLDHAPAGTLTERLVWARDVIERAEVARALEAHGTRTKAAAALGVTVQALSRTLTRHPDLSAQYPGERGGAPTPKTRKRSVKRDR